MIIFQQTYRNWENYLEFGTRQFFKEKTGVYKQDTIGDGFYYVHKGLIKVITSTTKEKDRMLNIVVPGQLLGLQTMDQQVHFTTAVTAKDSILYYFPYEKFKELLSLQPTFLNLFTKTVYKILKQWQKENLIEIQSRKLLIRDPYLLRNYVINS